MLNVFVAYVCWFFGGFFGWHQAYLDRPQHALAYCLSFGAFGYWWVFDFFYIPSYVRQANTFEDLELLQQFQVQRKFHKYPDLSIFGTLLQIFLASTALPSFVLCIPPEAPAWMATFLTLLSISILAYVIGMAEMDTRATASFRATLGGSIVGGLVLEIAQKALGEKGSFSSLPMVLAAIAFRSSREWKMNDKDMDGPSLPVKVPPRRGLFSRFFRHFIALGIIASLITGATINHGQFQTTDFETGELRTHKIRDAFEHFLKSPAFQEFKDTASETFRQMRENGWESAIESFLQALDPDGRKNAYRVLGIDKNANNAEIRAAYKRSALKYHPDKQSPEFAEEARNKFIEIQQAYELLTKSGRDEL